MLKTELHMTLIGWPMRERTATGKASPSDMRHQEREQFGLEDMERSYGFNLCRKQARITLEQLVIHDMSQCGGSAWRLGWVGGGDSPTTIFSIVVYLITELHPPLLPPSRLQHPPRTPSHAHGQHVCTGPQGSMVAHPK